MKHPKLLLTAALILLLTACSPSPKNQSFQLNLSLPSSQLTSDAFSEPLEPLEPELAWALYRLEDFGLSMEEMTGVIAFRSSGATCEELALFGFSDESAAKTACTALEDYLGTQIDTNRNYRPQDIPKLEHAFLEQRGTSVLLMVANDYKAADNLIVP